MFWLGCPSCSLTQGSLAMPTNMALSTCKPAVYGGSMTYPQRCMPGSLEWIRREKLSHLVAVCLRCHEDAHGVSFIEN